MWKLGAVSFLNSLPLYQPLLNNPEVSVVRAVPSQLAALVDAGEVDAALLPIVDHLRGHGDGLLSDACIGADGFVRSVVLFSKVPVQEIQSIAADTSSHTSVALLGVLLRDHFKIEPALKDAPPQIEKMLEEADAALLIGDPALEVFLAPGDLYVYDLASAWKELTGQPFVFAGWIARTGLTLEQKAELGALLSNARDTGTGMVPELARQHAAKGQFSEAVVEMYLGETIRYRIKPDYAAAIEEFRRRLGLPEKYT